MSVNSKKPVEELLQRLLLSDTAFTTYFLSVILSAQTVPVFKMLSTMSLHYH